MTAPPRPPECADNCVYLEWLEQQLESCEAARDRWEATAEHRQAQLDTLQGDLFSLHKRVAALEARFDEFSLLVDEAAEAYPLEPED